MELEDDFASIRASRLRGCIVYTVDPRKRIPTRKMRVKAQEQERLYPGLAVRVRRTLDQRKHIVMSGVYVQAILRVTGSFHRIAATDTQQLPHVPVQMAAFVRMRLQALDRIAHGVCGS